MGRSPVVGPPELVEPSVAGRCHATLSPSLPESPRQTTLLELPACTGACPSMPHRDFSEGHTHAHAETQSHKHTHTGRHTVLTHTDMHRWHTHTLPHTASMEQSLTKTAVIKRGPFQIKSMLPGCLERHGENTVSSRHALFIGKTDSQSTSRFLCEGYHLKMNYAEIAPPFPGCSNSNSLPNFSLCYKTHKSSVENHYTI